MEKLVFLFKKITSVDLFTLFNSLLFLMMTKFVYYDRFITYRGAANIHEFFFYATVIYVAILYFWTKLRYIKMPLYILILFEAMILLHFAAAFVEINGHRLYDLRIFEIRFDKFVHFINALIATIITFYFFQKNQCKITKFMMMMTVFSVLGIGAVIEIVEYIVTLTVEHNGVGAYNNNMLDLVANLFGSVTAVLLFKYILKDYICDKDE